MAKLTFLGTGGGRFVTLMQERSTGGLYLDDGTRVHVDPGPGALHALRRNLIDPTRTDALLISHCHPDHYANAETLIEGMVTGHKGKRGTLIAPRSVLKGSGRIGPGISRYHQEKLGRVHLTSPGDEWLLGRIKGRTTPSMHSDPYAVGFRFNTSSGVISYVADTELRREIIDAHMGARVLILATTRPLRARIPHHLSTEDAAVFAERIEPELCILTHLGKRFLTDGPTQQAEWIKNRTGVPTIAANDDMVIHISDELQVSLPPRREA
ncbi:MBL fold metallo-hydrolase [Thermoplasmatales archaeon ex4484_6]|nr:MAG: MBL fold metallo-hydrolase [Thermoplasmatales archaeon ex4484_6]